MSDSSPDAHGLVDRIRQERAAAAAAMTSLGGNTSTCAMGRDGRPFPAYKYHEGRAAALGRLGRRLRSAGSADLRTIVAGLVGEWQAEVDRRAGAGRDWEAYAAGGLDAARAAESWLADSPA
ncbi:hypothetical protein GA0111570_104134 [Raineyella antarctica]|uniref:Uncharacterized protein n=1 Tax=Raineyella antarctica TaxID=1577474 RepID=A0A1G6GMY7_9ACTN|nr:hypothetical protein [Raineyella antarctica]SDB83400.1 hypothetical protein GA0111570_104134 [Raineyella antarctica]